MLRVQADVANHAGDFPRVIDDDFPRLPLPQPGEVLKHFPRRFEMQGRLFIAAVFFHRQAVFHDGAEDGVLRVQEMHVARRNDRDARLLPRFDQRAVDGPQLPRIRDHASSHQFRRVFFRLDFDKIVKPREALDF